MIITIKLMTMVFMIWIVLRGTGQIFYTMSFNFSLFDAFLMIKSSLFFFERITQGRGAFSLHPVSGYMPFTELSMVNVNLVPLVKVLPAAFAAGALFSPFHTLFFGNKSVNQATFGGEGWW